MVVKFLQPCNEDSIMGCWMALRHAITMLVGGCCYCAELAPTIVEKMAFAVIRGSIVAVGFCGLPIVAVTNALGEGV